MLLFLLWIFLGGLIVGGLARLLLPGPDPMGLGMTALVGVGGSVIGAVAGNILLGRPGGFLLSLLAAMLLVYLLRRSRVRW